MAAATEAATRPRIQEPHEAARSFAVVSEPVTPLPQTTAKTTAKRDSQRENALPQTTAKPPEAARSFAVASDLLTEDDPAAFNPFAAIDSREWRIERRYRLRQDGCKIMYWNYRRRSIRRAADGRQLVEYRKGGSRIVS